jgi:excisionase family DNA binding protein
MSHDVDRWFYTIPEVSKAMHMSRRFVENEINARRLRVHKFGKRCTRISRDNLEEWIALNAQSQPQ